MTSTIALAEGMSTARPRSGPSLAARASSHFNWLDDDSSRKFTPPIPTGFESLWEEIADAESDEARLSVIEDALFNASLQPIEANGGGGAAELSQILLRAGKLTAAELLTCTRRSVEKREKLERQRRAIASARRKKPPLRPAWDNGPVVYEHKFAKPKPVVEKAKEEDEKPTSDDDDAAPSTAAPATAAPYEPYKTIGIKSTPPTVAVVTASDRQAASIMEAKQLFAERSRQFRLLFEKRAAHAEALQREAVESRRERKEQLSAVKAMEEAKLAERRESIANLAKASTEKKERIAQAKVKDAAVRRVQKERERESAKEEESKRMEALRASVQAANVAVDPRAAEAAAKLQKEFEERKAQRQQGRAYAKAMKERMELEVLEANALSAEVIRAGGADKQAEAEMAAMRVQAERAARAAKSRNEFWSAFLQSEEK